MLGVITIVLSTIGLAGAKYVYQDCINEYKWRNGK